MTPAPTTATLVLVAILALGLATVAGCGGGDGDGDQAVATPTDGPGAEARAVVEQYEAALDQAEYERACRLFTKQALSAQGGLDGCANNVAARAPDDDLRFQAASVDGDQVTVVVEKPSIEILSTYVLERVGKRLRITTFTHSLASS